MSVKRIILASLLFLLVFVISVVAHFPASVAYRLLPPLQGVQLSGISGTVWDGQVASVSVSNNQVGKLSLGKVNWQVDFTRLFKGAGALDIRFGQGSSIGLSGRGTVGYGLDGLFAERLMVSLPADKVGPYIPSMVPLSLKGKVDLTVREFQAGQPLCRVLDGNLVWNDSEVIVPVGEVALGQVFGKLGCTGGEITVAADQKSDALESEANVKVTNPREVSANGWIKPGPALPSSVSQQLQWLGQPDAEGRYAIHFPPAAG